MPSAAASHGPRRVPIDDPTVFRHATTMANLEQAWAKVLANGGAGGGDGVTLRQFLVNAPMRLARLQHALATGHYQPGPLRRVDIPKRDGAKRGLAIPPIVDRVAQTALLLILAPLIDPEMEDSSFAYRAGRSVQAAVERVRALHAAGQIFLVDADIEDFFDNVPHDKLMVRLAETMTDGPATNLIGLWLEHSAAGGRGLAQGSPLSPLLANLFLDRLDEAFADRDAHIVRFADDFVILTASQAGADAAHAKVRRMLAEQGLALNAGKTRVTSFDQGFRFLGHLFVRSLVLPGQGGDAADEATALMRSLAEADERAGRKAAEAEEQEATDRLHGLDAGQRVLYITSADRRLSVRNQGFSVQAGSTELGGAVTWREILALHHNAVDRIELGPDATATMDAQRLALSSDTALAFVNGYGETLGWLAPRFGPRAGRHLAQARHALDPALRLALARRFVDGRIRNQRALLRRLNRDRQDPAVVKALAGLNGQIRAIDVPRTLAELLGHEGRSAALFWPAFGRLLGGDFNFRVREREKPPDGVNVLLNVTAHLLTRDITVAIERAGLHPGFGMLHGSADGSDGAVYDLMEEFRAPMAESTVAQALSRRAITAQDFVTREDGGVRLLPAGYTAMLRTYEQSARREVVSHRDGKRRTWRGIMLDQAQALAAHVEDRGAYTPYLLDY